MTGPINGRVAQILNERELVINRGDIHGVEKGMKFAVINPKGLNIVDPETREPLGSIDIAKVTVKVTQVYEKLCVATTFRTFRSEGGPLYGVLGPAFDFARPPKVRVETLRTNESTYVQELDDEDSYVHVGDPVVEIVGDEFAAAQGGS